MHVTTLTVIFSRACQKELLLGGKDSNKNLCKVIMNFIIMGPEE
jgi:hypothetical protein